MISLPGTLRENLAGLNIEPAERQSFWQWQTCHFEEAADYARAVRDCALAGDAALEGYAIAAAIAAYSSASPSARATV